MSLKVKRDSDPIEMDLSSMVDIVFLLLIYFLVATSIKQDESELKVAIPIDREMVQTQQLEFPDEVVIDVLENGEVYWNGQYVDSPTSVELPELKNTLAELKAEFPTQPVVIRGQRATQHQRIVSVLNACSYAGIENISFPSDSSVYVE